MNEAFYFSYLLLAFSLVVVFLLIHRANNPPKIDLIHTPAEENLGIPIGVPVKVDKEIEIQLSADGIAGLSDFIKLLAQNFGPISAVFQAIGKVDDDAKVQLAISELKKVRISVASAEDEQDLKSVFRLVNALFHTVNEPDGARTFRNRLLELKTSRLIDFSDEGHAELSKLIKSLQVPDKEPLPSNFNDYVDAVQSVVLSPPVKDHLIPTDNQSSGY